MSAEELEIERRHASGHCPLSLQEVAMFIKGLGYPSKTPIFIAGINFLYRFLNWKIVSSYEPKQCLLTHLQSGPTDV
eukprot:4256418-Pyramimonas_sp.AAC.2